MVIQENRLEFSFRDGTQAIKYDDTPFYRQRYERLPGAKGVDILAVSPTVFYIIEVKDCSDTAQNQDKWRRSFSQELGMNTLAEEIALKVAHTCAALVGVKTFGERCAAGEVLQPMANSLTNNDIPQLKKRLLVLLYLEGDFSCQTRPNEEIYRGIRDRIARKLKWLNCYVDVVSTSTHKAMDFSVQLVPKKEDKG